ncbi:rhodopsin-like isoform X2 [Convolutriloba macropyga]
MLLLNLAVIDLIMVLSCQPIALVSSIRRGWYFGSIGCTISGCFATFGGLGSISSMAIIAYDRYVLVSFPLEVRRIATKRRAMRMIIFVWLYASMFAILPLFGYGGFVLNGFQTSCTFDYISQNLNTRTFLIFMYLMGFVCPFIITIFCYWSMFDYARNCVVPGDDVTRIKHQQKRELQMAKVSILSVSLFLLAWSPYAVVALIGQFWGANHINPYVSTIPALFAKSQCIYNTFVYGCGHPSYRLVTHLITVSICKILQAVHA